MSAASVSVTPASAVGDFHQLTSPIVMAKTLPIKLLAKINKITVKPNGKNCLPTFQSIVSVTNPLTKSTIHSTKFWNPVGFICKLRPAKYPKIITTIEVTTNIKINDRSTDNHGTPNTFSTIGDFVSIDSPLFHLIIDCYRTSNLIT